MNTSALVSTSISTPMENAKRFLIENPTESKTTAARIFGLNVKTLTASICRGSGEKHRGQNQILKDHEIKAIDYFIRSLLAHEIPPTHQIIFNAIVGLKRAHDPTNGGPSKRWFWGWWKQSNLHKIKIKPLPMI